MGEHLSHQGKESGLQRTDKEREELDDGEGEREKRRRREGSQRAPGSNQESIHVHSLTSQEHGYSTRGWSLCGFAFSHVQIKELSQRPWIYTCGLLDVSISKSKTHPSDLTVLICDHLWLWLTWGGKGQFNHFNLTSTDTIYVVVVVFSVKTWIWIFLVCVFQKNFCLQLRMERICVRPRSRNLKYPVGSRICKWQTHLCCVK